jgi:hypothetical protein
LLVGSNDEIATWFSREIADDGGLNVDGGLHKNSIAKGCAESRSA